MENILYYKKQIVTGLIIMLLFLIASLFIYNNSANKKGKERNVNTVNSTLKNDANLITEANDENQEETKDANTNNNKYVFVDVKGYVSNPGVYKLKKDSIVNDVLIAAGGLKEEADTICVNLSKKVYDEMVIYVHSKTEIKDMENDGEIKKDDVNLCPNIENSAYTPYKEESDYNVIKKENEEEDSKTKETPKDKVNINTADIDTLTTLPNIGKSKAQAIISYREQNGNFKSIEDIINVSGIGESTFNKIKDYLTI